MFKCWKAAQERARRAAEEVPLQGLNSRVLGSFVVFVLIADSQMDPYRHMLATQDTVEIDSGIRCRVSFLFELQDCASASTTFHQH